MEWKFLINPFLVIARESRKRAIEISSYTDAALEQRQADVFFGPLYTFYHPLHVAVTQEESEWGVQKGVQKGKTKSLDDLLDELSPGKINLWERQIGIVFAPGSPQYIALLPNGIAPFGRGKKDDRIELVRVLSQALIGIAPLAATKTAVDAFYATLIAARTLQKGQISDTKDESDDVTVVLRTAVDGLYAVLGACMQQFASNPLLIKPIFDISKIRDLEQTSFTATLPKGIGVTKNIAKRTVPATQKIKITVHTPAAIEYSIVEEKNDEVSVKKVVVQGLEDEIFDASQLQVSPNAAFLKARNTDGSVDGNFTIEFL